MKLYSRVEFLSSVPTRSDRNIALIQRTRFGLQFNKLSFGQATDVNEIGRKNFNSQSNSGIFFRNEF